MPQLINDAKISHIYAILSVFNEYVKRGQKWKLEADFRRKVKKDLSHVVKNMNISFLKKMQIIIFAYFPILYRYLMNKNGEKHLC